ncbi:MAG: hypothetical protein AAFO74_13025 [Pseudomonadota bacterium]
MPMAQVAGGHYEPDGIGDGRKVCINLYSEPNENDPNRPMRNVMRPGAVDRDTGNVLQFTPRGVGQVDGHADGDILVVDGAMVRRFNTSTSSWSALSGSISGSDRVRMAFSEVEGAILSGGQIYVSTGSAIAQATDADYATHLSNHSQTSFLDIASIGQRLLFIYGSRLGWSETLDFNNTQTTYFLTTEDSPDANVALAVLNGIVYVLGTETIQPFVQTGGEGAAAFRPQNNSTIQRGCLSKHTVQQLDNTLFWVGDDYNVYRLNGLTPQLISKPWLSRRLRSESVDDLVATYLELEGHSFYILNGVNGCYAYDGSSGEWFLWKTYEQDTFEWAQIVEASGNHFAISRLGSQFAQLSRSYETDLGVEIVLEFSAHLPVIGGRRPIPSIRVDGTKGRGSATDAFADAYISMALSKDNGITFGSYRPRSIGKQGEYRKRAIWRQNGRAREPQVIARFRTNDPVIVNGVAVGED